MKYWLDYQRCRFMCFLKDHEPTAMVNWHPEEVCLRIVCSRCGKGIGHFHLPAKAAKLQGTLH